jgi:hypothetical protein
MDEIRNIFIKFFLVIFGIVFLLAGFGLYQIQSEIDFKFLLQFSISIASLGAAIAALFIGIFRKLDAEPPRVEPSEYIETDEDIINHQLAKLRQKRILLFTMFGMWIPFGFLILSTGLPVYFLFGYIIALAIVGFVLQFVKCPRCGHYFQFRGAMRGKIGDTGNETINLLFGGGFRNFLSDKCLNCGLKSRKDKA